MVYLTNAFSISMLTFSGKKMKVEFEKVDMDHVKTILSDGFSSAIGHEDTARILSGMLGMEVPVARVAIKIAPSDILIVAQYIGPRLPEGATTLPAGAKIEFFKVVVLE